MQKLRLGKSMMEVSKVGFGGIPIQRISEDDAIKLIHRAVELGVDWLDTANGYDDSEEKIGKAIETLDRKTVKIFSKAGGKTPDQLRQQVLTSLERLRTDHIDLYQFHGVGSAEIWRQMRENGTVNVLVEMKKAGTIGHIGASAHSPDAAMALAADPLIEVLQWPFNFIVAPNSCDILAKCEKNDVGFIAMKPFGGGQLDNAGVCIRFLMQYDTVAPDPGFQKIEELEEVVKIVESAEKLSKEDEIYIERTRKELGTRFCRLCGYCMPCEQEVSISALMGMKGLLKRLPPDKLFDGWVSKAAESLENCNECGLCEKKCPYDLSIMEQIKKGAQIFREYKEQYRRESNV